jgi:hypothetical protein
LFDIYIGILLGAHPILHISRIRVKGVSKGKERTLLVEVIEVKLYAIQNSVYAERTLD